MFVFALQRKEKEKKKINAIIYCGKVTAQEYEIFMTLLL